ncbi:hypothetical protein XBI1_2960042 [Xenorhabdus bovienii str. Intermedium]|uniref:Uncharacterized protein n=1 Tax=Xenorhabdus bovienii str. Intermedium TaxID=1379677 RepID=A0A077QLG6_XENBV|nr:hypothetical protein XBI1_2960042 [Xenorhabdus bovienii str. Intermedium]
MQRIISIIWLPKIYEYFIFDKRLLNISFGGFIIFPHKNSIESTVNDIANLNYVDEEFF